ncbi:GNAT family N-acetyltransferase [Oceanobacillus profundus]|uniref:GNAT family N-acetyltransferase n=1 Tax=Oceanobacillus profundus TaxID=372463 RepID=UPI000BA5336E|nr:GNAT family N-acetyltransferase [Oceanobacillus profundus]MBR3118317.1 GNAT family N-acetyltransferase [Oceanobacillus sp.]MCM3398163.1 GNAT family N-acetyltransferase [Oceanobacillus profundus]PAE29231.1 GNAT family N-acetyltransferase [Paenibacillus sp. 7884-2]
MISELKKDKFYKCKYLLSDQGLLEARAVIEGVNPGRVFVDDMDTPASGLVWLGNNDGFIFIGNEKNERFNKDLNHFIDTIIMPEATEVELKWFEGIGEHRKWDATIKEVFKKRKLGSWNQRVYTLHKDDYSYNDEFSITQGYKLMKVCKDIFENKGNSIKNIAFLRSKILESWSSSETFFHNGMGYCMIYKNEIVSLCFSGFVAGNVHAVTIETIEEHRGKKLAQNIAKAFVNDCLDNNKIPYWDCMESNKSSIAVAENIGFRNIFNYIGYEFSFNNKL